MSKDPAFLFYSSDFLTGTALMADRQVGQYIRLMCLQHQYGHLSEEQMLKVCKKRDPDIWSKFKQDESGLYYNARLESEIGKRNSYCESRRKNRETKNICETYEKHMSPHMENENVNINITPVKEKKEGCGGSRQADGEFDVFWSAYPRKVGKEAARKAYAKVDVDLQTTLSAISQQKKSNQWTRDGGQYIPHPATWLNQKRWEDEPMKPSEAPSKPKRKSWAEIAKEVSKEYDP